MLFEKVAQYFEKLEKVSSRIEMTRILSEMLGESEAVEIGKLVYLCQGKIAPEYEGIEIGMGEKFVEEAIAKIAGESKEKVGKEYLKKGDLGIVAQEMCEKKAQKSLFSEKLSVHKVYENLSRIARASGTGSQESKILLLAELLNSASSLEAKYLVRFPLGNMRLGIGDPTIMDALAWLYVGDYMKDEEITKRLEEKKIKDEEEYKRRVKDILRERIEAKYNIHPDLGEIAQRVKAKGISGLDEIKLEYATPIRPSLAERLPTSEDIIKKIGECFVESKYDGLRLQGHKKGKNVTLFSRKLENVTPMFPEIVEAVRTEITANEAMFEGEALAFNEEAGEFYPFQVTVQRKRKHGIEKMSQDYPLKLFVFDAMLLDGENLMGKPFSERRKIVEKMTEAGKTIRPTEIITANSAEKIDAFFESAIERGLEGIIAKDPKAPYIAGARKFSWIKLKRSYRGELSDSVDVVIIGYFKGKGARTKFGLGALLTAVYDKKEDSFRSIAKIGTGFSEEQIEALEKMLSKTKTKQRPARVVSEIEPDVWVEPRHVIEVVADEITKSPLHTAGKKGSEPGFALRFPRIVGAREDKAPEDATTVEEIIKMHKNQKAVLLDEGELA